MQHACMHESEAKWLEEERSMNISKSLRLVTEMLTILRNSYYERIAFLPAPRESTDRNSTNVLCADNLLFPALDNLVRNYISNLNMYGKAWDNIVSLSGVSGPKYKDFHRTFHVSLSVDMKYFIPGYISLAHAIGHGANETRLVLPPWHTAGNGADFIPPAHYRFLHLLFSLQHELSKYTMKPNHENCRKCPLSIDIEIMNQIHSREKFVRTIASRTSIIVLYDQILADIVALVIAGPNYLRALLGFARPPFLKRDLFGNFKRAFLGDDFVGAMIRATACTAYATRRNFGWKNECLSYLGEVESKIWRAILQNLSAKQAHFWDSCWSCSMNFGAFSGTVLGVNNEQVFGDIFRSGSILENKRNIIKELKSGHIVSHEEPRDVLHAYLELIKQKECPDLTLLLRSLV